MKAIAHAFFRLAPNVVVYKPILKLAKSIIPNVMKNKDVSFDNTILASIPIRIVTTQSIFPKSDECNDFEYSFFFANFMSSNCIAAIAPNTIGILYQNSLNSKLRYPKYVESTITIPTTNEPTSEKYLDPGFTKVRENLSCIFETSSDSCSIIFSRS